MFNGEQDDFTFKILKDSKEMKQSIEYYKVIKLNNVAILYINVTFIMFLNGI